LVAEARQKAAKLLEEASVTPPEIVVEAHGVGQD